MSRRPQSIHQWWDMFSAKIFVYALEAQGLSPSDTAGTSADPQLKLFMGKKTEDSKVVKKTLNPLFDQTFIFFDPDQPELRLEVWCNKKKKFLGKALVFANLTDIEEDIVVDKWVSLEARPGKKKDRVSGRVHLRIFVSRKPESRPAKLEYAPLTEHFAHFKPGDMIVMSGTGLLDTYVQLVSGYNFSRVGIIVEHPNKWTRQPELYLLEATRNIDNFPDVTEPTTPRRNALCMYRLHERLFHLYAHSIWWLPLKQTLTEHQKFKMNEIIVRLHQDPQRLPVELAICDPKIPAWLQSLFAAKSLVDPLEYVDLYSSSLAVEILRHCGIFSAPNSNAFPCDVVNLECIVAPILLRPPVGTTKIPSTNIAGSSDIMDREKETFIQTALQTVYQKTYNGSNNTPPSGASSSSSSSTLPPMGSSSFSGGAASSSSSGSVSRELSGSGTSLNSLPSVPTPPDARQHFTCSSFSQTGVTSTDRQMVLPDFRTCPMMKLDKLGSGGFGAVWRVSLEGYTCACKVVKISSETDSYDIEALKLETAILERAQHPNIVRYLGHDFRADEMHLFLELMPYSLRDIIKNMRPADNDPHTVRKISHEISKGLHYLHSFEPPIIHRDIKAENILLTKDGEGRIDQVKICDFGVSKLTEGASEQAQAQTYVGTLAFMAPEIRKGQGRKAYSAQVDVYSFGVLLYELLALRPASKGIDKDFLAQLRKQRDWERLTDLCILCLDANPDRRPTSAVMCQGLAVMFAM